MPMATFLKLSTSIAICFALLVGCSSTSTTESSGNANLDKLNSELNAIAENNSCNASFQCKVAAVGARACGGPSRYVVYSTLNNSQEQVQMLVAQITDVEQKVAEQGGINDCSPVIPVQTLCLQQQCQVIEVK